MPLFWIIFAFSLLNFSQSSLILFVTIPEGKSHVMAMLPLAEALVRRGHVVTILTETFANDSILPSHPGIRFQDIKLQTEDLQVLGTVVHENSTAFADMTWNYDFTSPIGMLFGWYIFNPYFDWTMEQKGAEFGQILANRWSLILVDDLVSTTGYAIAATSAAPYGMFSTSLAMSGPGWWRSFPHHPATISPMLSGADFDHQSFRSRFSSLTDYLLEIGVYYLNMEWIVGRSVRKFNSNYGISDFSTKIQFSVSDFPTQLEFVRPNVPDLVYLGSSCPQNVPKGLPEDFQSFLDKTQHLKWSILVAFGTQTIWKLSPKAKIDIFLETFKLLSDFRIFWKYSGPPIKNLPSNVFIKPYLPQKELLNHPSTKVFLTHGGLKSIRESLCAGVPMVIVPFFAEQPRNALILLKKGIGLKLNKMTMTVGDISEALKTVLRDESYGENAKQMQIWLKDTLIQGDELGGFWTDFASRRGGLPAKFFHNGGKKLNFCQYFYIDIFLALVVAIYMAFRLIFVF